MQFDFDIKQARKDFFTPSKYDLTPYLVDHKAKFAVICPGGGYSMVCSYAEGIPYAQALNEMGYSAFVLRYHTKRKAKWPTPMDDLARAVRYILDNAEKFNVETEGYSVWGSSAGAHLTACYGMEREGFRKYGLPEPGAIVLCYPGIVMDEGLSKYTLGKSSTQAQKDELSPNLHVDPMYPPTFLWCCETDEVVPYWHSERMAQSLSNHGVAHQLNIYKTGKHGTGLSKGQEAEGWFKEAIDFWERQTKTDNKL